MLAQLKAMHSPDVQDLRTFCPADEHNFGFALDLMIGPRDDDSAERFSVQVCTPAWLGERVVEPRLTRGLLLVSRYDYDELERFLKKQIESLSADDWKQLGTKLSRRMS